MTDTDTRFREAMCDRFLLAQEATGLSAKQFGAQIGLSPSQMTNIKTYRNPPSHEAIRNVVREFGFTADWFYFGSRAGFRVDDLADRLRNLEARPVPKSP